MIKKNTKGYLRDKYIKNPQRFWDIEGLKKEFKPGVKYIFKNNTFFYIKKTYTQQLTKKEIIDKFWVWFFENNFKNKYFQLSTKWYYYYVKANEYLAQLKKITEIIKKTKLENYFLSKCKVELFYIEEYFSKTKRLLKTMTVSDFMLEYNLKLSDLYRLLIFESGIPLFGNYKKPKDDLTNHVELTNESKLNILSIVEDYLKFSLTRHQEKLTPLFSSKENKLACQYFSIPENIILTNSDILKCFNKTKGYIIVKNKIKNKKCTAPRFYRKYENKRILHKFENEWRKAFKNWDYDLISTQWFKFIKNGSYYF